jgi:hypothetical protein
LKPGLSAAGVAKDVRLPDAPSPTTADDLTISAARAPRGRRLPGLMRDELTRDDGPELGISSSLPPSAAHSTSGASRDIDVLGRVTLLEEGRSPSAPSSSCHASAQSPLSSPPSVPPPPPCPTTRPFPTPPSSPCASYPPSLPSPFKSITTGACGAFRGRPRRLVAGESRAFRETGESTAWGDLALPCASSRCLRVLPLFGLPSVPNC